MVRSLNLTGEFGWIMAGSEEKQSGVPFDLPVGKADCCYFHGWKQ